MNYYDWALVIDSNDIPCTPITPKKAKLLLEENRAEIIEHRPFVIKRTDGYMSENENRSDMLLKIDTGYLHIGFSVCDKVNEYLCGQVDIRNNISGLLFDRKNKRKGRRNRTRHRENKCCDKKIINNPTFKNGNEIGWRAPSIMHKIETHLNLINKIKKWIPVNKIHVEIGHFDPQKIVNPDIQGVEYQNGEMKGYEHVKAYVRYRDECKCAICEKKGAVQVHHLVMRSEGGTDRPSNLITLCSECHAKVHENNHAKVPEIRERFLNEAINRSLKAATGMNIMKDKLIELIVIQNPDIEVIREFGCITNLNRNRVAKLPKTHYADAVCIGEFNTVNLAKYIYIIEQKRCNNRVMEKWADAEYIDSRDGKKKAGTALCKIKAESKKRSTNAEHVINNRVFRAEKVSPGKRTHVNNWYMWKAGDIVLANYEDMHNELRIIYQVSKRENKKGELKLVISHYPIDEREVVMKLSKNEAKKRCKHPTVSYENIINNSDTRIKLVRFQRGMVWRRYDRLEYEKNNDIESKIA